MDHNPYSFRSVRVPTGVWVAAAAILVTGIAIFVFKVAFGTVFAFALFGFMLLSLWFMHENQSSNGNQSENSTIQNGEISEQKNSNHQNHKGCCH